MEYATALMERTHSFLLPSLGQEKALMLAVLIKSARSRRGGKRGRGQRGRRHREARISACLPLPLARLSGALAL